MNRRRLLLRILNGSRNVAFSDFVNLIEGLDVASAGFGAATISSSTRTSPSW